MTPSFFINISKGVKKLHHKKNRLSIHILLIFSITAIAIGCRKNEINAEGEVIGSGKWDETYKGIAVFSSGSLNAQGEYFETDLEEGVIVEAENGSSFDRFTVSIQFANTPELIHKDYRFTGNNIYTASWGNNFGSGSLTIRFTADSIYYSSFQNCGTACFNQIEIAARRSP